MHFDASSIYLYDVIDFFINLVQATLTPNSSQDDEFDERTSDAFS